MLYAFENFVIVPISEAGKVFQKPALERIHRHRRVVQHDAVGVDDGFVYRNRFVNIE